MVCRSIASDLGQQRDLSTLPLGQWLSGKVQFLDTYMIAAPRSYSAQDETWLTLYTRWGADSGKMRTMTSGLSKCCFGGLCPSLNA